MASAGSELRQLEHHHQHPRVLVVGLDAVDRSDERGPRGLVHQRALLHGGGENPRQLVVRLHLVAGLRHRATQILLAEAALDQHPEVDALAVVGGHERDLVHHPARAAFLHQAREPLFGEHSAPMIGLDQELLEPLPGLRTPLPTRGADPPGALDLATLELELRAVAISVRPDFLDDQ